MDNTIEYNKVELDKKIIELQNEYIVCSPVMLRKNVDRGFIPLEPDDPLLGSIVDDKIDAIFEFIRLGKLKIDILKFPYAEELGTNMIASFNDLKQMPVDDRATIARKHVIDTEFYRWVYIINSHIPLDI